MEIKGTIISDLGQVSGQGKNGEWLKREYVIETQGNYPKKVCFEMWNDSIQDLPIGSIVTAHIDVESREYNERWYTNIKAWKVDVNGSQSTQPQQEAPSIDIEPEEDDDLPF